MSAHRPRAQSRRLRIAKAGDQVVAQYGGHPRGIRLQDWPRCRVCGAPMCHMMQLSAGPWLDMGPFQRATVFICHATGGRCEDWDPWKGANAVILQKNVDDELYDGPHTVRVYRKQQLAIEGVTDEAAVAEEVRAGNIPVSEAVTLLRHDKLGGRPVWVTGDASPKGLTTGAPMNLLCQFTTQLTAFDITANGVGYVFFDPTDDSARTGVLIWQGT